MWFALMIIGIWGFSTLAAYITDCPGIFLIAGVVTIIAGFGYICALDIKVGK